MTSTVSLTNPPHDERPDRFPHNDQPNEFPADERLARLFCARLTAAGLPAIRQPHLSGNPVRTTAPDGVGWCLEVAVGQLILYRDAAPAGQDPRRLADLGAVLLTGEPVAGRPDLDFDPAGHTLKGAVGRDLKLRGFHVDLSIGVDNVACEVFSEVRATSPDPDDRRTLFVADDGMLTCLFEVPAGSPADALTTVADTVTTAVRT